jgi:membrane fusion protein (multidrug efflux system)
MRLFMHRKSILPRGKKMFGLKLPTRMATRCMPLVLVLLVVQMTSCEQKPPQALPPQIVLTMDVVSKNETVYNEWIGTLTGSVNASIRAQVGGYLIKQDYQEGTAVKTGQVLFEIDPRPYQATLDQAKGDLANAQANQLKSQQDLARYKALVASGAVSQQEYQNEVQVNDANLAAVQSAQGAVQSAQLNLGYTKIKSAIDGIAGIAEAQVGDLIGQNSEMTTVSTVDPIKAVFNIPEQLYLAFMQSHPELAQQEAAQKNAVLTLLLSDGLPYDQKGKLDIVNRQINQDTGTIQLIGLFPNPNSVLRPGAFVRVRMSGAKKQDSITIPQQAVIQLQTIYMVAVVTPDPADPGKGTVNMKTVQVGNQIGNNWLITDGLKPGDKIVVEGTNKVREGEKVDYKPWAPPSPPAATTISGTTTPATTTPAPAQ